MFVAMTRFNQAATLLCALSLAACASAPISKEVRAPRPDAGPHFIQHPPVQCAPYARMASGITIFGDANTWWTQAAGRYPRSTVPSVGSVIAIRTFADGARGHVAVVRAIAAERVIIVDHANWHGREEVALNVPVRDVSAAGDWSQVKVWWLETNSWGAKTYEVEGFIHPR
jgi:hypothetical protein